MTPKRKKLIWIGVFLCLVGLYIQFGRPIYHMWQEHELLNEDMLGKIVIIKIPSEFMNSRVKLFVYTPPGYTTSNRKYPVIYMLHGMPGAGRDWFVKGRVHATAESLMMTGKMTHAIIVGFDAFGRRGEHSRSEYLDSTMGGPLVESFITSELVPYIDSNYRTIPDNRNRAIIGLSSGGFGAANTGLKHQDMFLTIASHSGFFDPTYEKKYVVDILGPESKAWDANDPDELVDNNRVDPRFAVYMDIGKGDDLLKNNRYFAKELRKHHLRSEFHALPGSHHWWFWKWRVRYSLLFVSHRFKILNNASARVVSTSEEGKTSVSLDLSRQKLLHKQ